MKGADYKQLIKEALYYGFYVVWWYIGFRLAFSQDPEINWIIKLIGFFGWVYIPYYLKTKKT